jgi:iron(III) transport system substrate-binding protein
VQGNEDCLSVITPSPSGHSIATFCLQRSSHAYFQVFKSLAVTGLVAFAAAASAQKTQLLVYTALETDQLKAYQEGFNKVNPDIEIKWVRDSTGVITAKLLAEKANPQADAVMGVAASSLALLDKKGMLVPYAPLNLDAIMSQYRDKKNPPAWFGMDVWGATVCFNTVEAQKRNIPKPETWKDLTKPAYKGQVVMPNPRPAAPATLT